MKPTFSSQGISKEFLESVALTRGNAARKSKSACATKCARTRADPECDILEVSPNPLFQELA
jgi:hypothetical protein